MTWFGVGLLLFDSVFLHSSNKINVVIKPALSVIPFEWTGGKYNRWSLYIDRGDLEYVDNFLFI